MPQHSQAVAYPSLLQEVERLSENNPGLVRLMSDDISPSQQQVYQALFLCAPFFVQKVKCSPFLKLIPTPRQMPRDVMNISED